MKLIDKLIEVLSVAANLMGASDRSCKQASKRTGKLNFCNFTILLFFAISAKIRHAFCKTRRINSHSKLIFRAHATSFLANSRSDIFYLVQ